MTSRDVTEVTAITQDSDERRAVAASAVRSAALMLVWSRDEPARVGEIILLPEGGDPVELGRGAEGDRPAARAVLVRQEPGVNVVRPPLASRRLSRTQLRLQALDPQRIAVDGLGRRPMRVNGVETAHAVVFAGDVVEVRGAAVFAVVERPRRLAAPLHAGAPPAAGRADRWGLIGESEAVWALRDLIAFAGPHGGHVLVCGPRGAGKELVARAVHAASDRAAAPLVARGAATIPEDLADAELFGTDDGDHDGLVGAAEGSTLLLDGVSALAEPVAARLVRLMDTGEYHRLGDPTPHRADVRIIMTAASLEAVPPVLRGRFRHVLSVPPLASRPEDVALIGRARLAEGLADHPDLAARLLDADGEPRLGSSLVAAALRAPLERGVRDLDALLWRAVATSAGDAIEAPQEGPRGRGGASSASPKPAAGGAIGPSVAPAQGPADAEPELPPGLPASVVAGLPEITKTERVVLQHLARNMTSRQIAKALFVSVRTVQNHRARICDKLGLRGANRLLGVALALADYLGPPTPDR